MLTDLFFYKIKPSVHFWNLKFIISNHPSYTVFNFKLSGFWDVAWTTSPEKTRCAYLFSFLLEFTHTSKLHIVHCSLTERFPLNFSKAHLNRLRSQKQLGHPVKLNRTYEKPGHPLESHQEARSWFVSLLPCMLAQQSHTQLLALVPDSTTNT